MLDEEHFLLSERAINGHTSEEMFACGTEDPYIFF